MAKKRLWNWIFRADSAFSVAEQVYKYIVPPLSGFGVLVYGYFENSSLTSVVVDALLTATCMLIIWDKIVALGKSVSRSRIARGNVGAIEEKVRQALDSFNLRSNYRIVDGLKKGVEVELNGNQFVIQREDNDGRYLIVTSYLYFSDQDNDALNKLPAWRRDQVTALIKLELSRAKIGYIFEMHKDIFLWRRIPVTTDLSEEKILDALHDVEAAIGQARAVFALAIIWPEVHQEAPCVQPESVKQ